MRNVASILYTVPAALAIALPAAAQQELHKLLPADGASGDRFGFGVFLAGGLAVVGAPNDDDNGIDSGSAYVFDAISGQQLLKLTPADGQCR